MPSLRALPVRWFERLAVRWGRAVTVMTVVNGSGPAGGEGTPVLARRRGLPCQRAYDKRRAAAAWAEVEKNEDELKLTEWGE